MLLNPEEESWFVDLDFVFCFVLLVGVFLSPLFCFTQRLPLECIVCEDD